MAHITTHVRPAPAHIPLTDLPRRVMLALTAARQRRHLADLDDAMLRDIGLTRAAALTEARRPVWDVPQSWLR